MIKYKYQDFQDNDESFKRQLSEDSNEKNKEVIPVNEEMINCFVNIPIYYKSGNTIRLAKILNFLNDVTLDAYFLPCSEFISNNIPNILIQIAFNKSESTKKELECQLYALSIIDNLTLEKSYGFVDIFDEFNIVNSACLLLLSGNLNIISYTIRILINYAELGAEFSEKILQAIPLETFLAYLIDIENDQAELHLYTASLLCQLSFSMKQQYVPQFYASVDYLLKFAEDFGLIKYIFHIVLNSIKADAESCETFTENEDLLGLIIQSINDGNETTLLETRLALKILAKFFISNNFIILDINLNVLFDLIDVLKEDISFPYLLIAFQSLIQSPIYRSLLLETVFISMLSTIFQGSSFRIKEKILILFSSIIEAYPTLDVLETFINNCIIDMLATQLDQTNIPQQIMIFNSLIHLLSSASQMSSDSQFIIINDFECHGETIFGPVENEEISSLQSHLNDLYQEFVHTRDS